MTVSSAVDDARMPAPRVVARAPSATPILTIRVVVPRPPGGATASPLAELEPRARRRIADLAARLGVTRSFEIQVAAGEQADDFAIDVGGAARGAAAASVLARAVQAAGADPLGDAPVAGDLGRNLIERLWRLGAAEPAIASRWCEAIALVIHDVVAMYPRDLLGDDDIAAIERAGEAWLSASGAASTALHPTVVEVVGLVIDEMVCIADRAQIAEIVGTGLAMALPAPDIAERVTDRLRTRAIEIAVHPEYLEDLLGTDLAVHQRDDRTELDVAELSRDIASELARRTGLVRPRVTFVEDWSLAPRRLVVLVNRTDRIEWQGPPVGARLYSASAGALVPESLVVSGGDLAREPGAGQVIGVWWPARGATRGAPGRAESTAGSGGDGVAFMVEAACDLVADRAALLVDRTSMLIRIAELERQAPYLASTVLELESVDHLVRVARVLARERVPLELAALFSSWLGRAVITAEVAADERPLDDRLVIDDALDEVSIAVQLARLDLVPRLLRQRADRLPARFLATGAAERLARLDARGMADVAIDLARRLPGPRTTPILLLVVPVAVRRRLAHSLRPIRPDVTVISLEEADAVADLLRPGKAIDLGP